MITEDYVSFEVAKLLKEKGFKILTGTVYDNQGKLDYQNVVCWQENRLPYISAPTHHMTMKWLRENYHLHISIDIQSDYSTDADGNIVDRWTYWTWSIFSTEDGSVIYMPQLFDSEQESFDEYKDAMEHALKYCLIKIL